MAIVLIAQLSILSQACIFVVAEQKPSFITVNEQLTFIGNISNQHKDLAIYGRENNTLVTIFSSDLVDNKSGKVTKMD